MSIKKAFKTLFVLIFLLGAQLWIQNHFSAETVYYEIGPITKATNVDKLKEWLPGLTINWELQTPHYKLIMTTGNDGLHRKLTGLDKPWVSPENSEAVLSSKVADRLYKSSDITSKSIQIMDRSYWVSSVIKEGNNVYIPYDPNLLTKPWNKIRIYYTTSSFEQSELDDARYSNVLSLLKLDVYHKGYAKAQVYLFYNLILITLLYLLFGFGQNLLVTRKAQKLQIESIYQSYKPFYGLKTFIRNEYKACLSFVLSHFAILGVLIVGVRLLGNLILPTTLFPTNWFSLNSYVEIFKQIYMNLQYKIQYGFSDLSGTVLILLILLVVYLVLLRKLFNDKKTVPHDAQSLNRTSL